MSFRLRDLIISFVFLISACAKLQKSATPEGLRLQLKPELNQAEVSQYHSRSSSRRYRNSMLDRKDQEQLDFKVKFLPVEVQPHLDPEKSRIDFKVTTSDKVGEGNLNEFAFPEIGKTLQISLNPYGDVLFVKDYPTHSVFYVPPLSLPKDRVKVGDTWALRANWKTAAEGIPLKLDMITIFKKQLACGGHTCAVLEVSGDVTIEGLSEEAKLESDVKGLLLFDVDEGNVLWSHVQSDQNLQTAEHRTELKNCLTSYLIKPENSALLEKVTPYCRIGDAIDMEKVPQL